ncbi:hypothetical protein [Deinococcus hopiensis]|uniref:Uncharacterized protein n=1 Tax=Deinococcus hopiensis KR-140 TaxID=695939 RepID=A0A1W1VFD8_9DEIO|nr:hypothetical protein [Deinococcus hopiensis]SMB92129.1 hypothetical protein SAMN00790413_01452 [Deinococcus hopiensis KR-140]
MSTLPGRKAPPIVGRPVLLEYAADDFLNEVTRQKPWKRARWETLLESLDAYLGASAPLLAYTQLTGEQWRRSLEGAEHEDAAELLTEFRAYLRDWGWLDCARPVNLPD